MRVDRDYVPASALKDGAENETAVKLSFDAPFDHIAAVTEIYRHTRDGKTVIAYAGDEAAALAGDARATGIDAVSLESIDGAAVRRLTALHEAIVLPGAVNAPATHKDEAKRGPKLRVAVAGLGLIGEGAALRLGAVSPDYEFCAALVREPSRERPNINVAQVTNDLLALFATRPDVIVDALPSGSAGNALIKAALERGVSIVTANKQAIAGSMRAFTELAGESGAAFCYSPAVGGGAPFIESIARARKSGEVASIEAVLNGTVNYILTALADGDTFEAAIKAAQEAGFAEPDPSADLSGADARAKLAIVSYAAFDEEISLDRIDVEALTPEKAARFAAEGGAWKQIARLTRDESGALAASVRFECRDADVLFAGAKGEANALRINLAGGGIVECKGKGAGRRPTVESILGDLGAIRRAGAKTAAKSVVTPETVLA